MYLKRGHITVIVGGAIVVISFSMLGYYAMQFLTAIQQDGKYVIQPGRSVNLTRSIYDAQGIYVIAFADLVGGQASVTIKDHVGKIVVDKKVNPPTIVEPFNTEVPGVYNLTLLNPTDQKLEAAIYFGGEGQMLSEKNYLFSAITMTMLMSLLGIGIAVAIVGIVITILDRRRINKMKHFGDTSDLI